MKPGFELPTLKQDWEELVNRLRALDEQGSDIRALMKDLRIVEAVQTVTASIRAVSKAGGRPEWTITKRDNLLEAMASAAAVGFYTAEAFGRNSDEHQTTLAPYEAARARYEAECLRLGRSAYATYNED